MTFPLYNIDEEVAFGAIKWDSAVEAWSSSVEATTQQRSCCRCNIEGKLYVRGK